MRHPWATWMVTETWISPSGTTTLPRASSGTTAKGGEPANTRSLVLEDLDGDGAIDIIVANRRQQNSIFFGDDSHRFERHERFGASDGSTIVISMGDLDGDGDLDVVVANRGQRNGIYLNSGAGASFREIRFGEPQALTYGVAAADLDGDGIPEIVTANSDGRNWVYRRVPGPE